MSEDYRQKMDLLRQTGSSEASRVLRWQVGATMRKDQLWKLAVCIVSLLCACTTVLQPERQEPLSITIGESIHFLSEDGEDVTASADTYDLEQAGPRQLRLVHQSHAEAAHPLVIDAVPISLGESVSERVVLHVLWKEEEHHLILLSRSGDGLEAIGFASGIRSRGSPPGPLPRSVVKDAL